MKNYVIIPCAFPRAGKSTFREALMARYPGEIICVCPDDIREELGGSRENFKNEKRVWALVGVRVEEAYNKGKMVFVDATNCSVRNRHPFVSTYPSVALVFDVSPEVCKQRCRDNKELWSPQIEEVIDKFAKNYVAPSLEEGFVGVYHIGDHVAPYGDSGLEFDFKY